MELIYIVILICLIWSLVAYSRKRTKNETGTNRSNRTERKVNLPIIKVFPKQALWKMQFKADLAGANYHCKKSDSGYFAGYVIPEPDNPHDPNAHAVYSRGKHLGYIPARHCEDFAEWCGGAPCAVIGEIFEWNGKMIGKLLAIRFTNKDDFFYCVNDYIRVSQLKPNAPAVPSVLRFDVRVEPEGEPPFTL